VKITVIAKMGGLAVIREPTIVEMTGIYVEEFMRDGKEHKFSEIMAHVSDRLAEAGQQVVTGTLRLNVYQALRDTSAYAHLEFSRYQSFTGFHRFDNSAEDRRMSVSKKVKLYMTEFMSDGKVHTKGEAISYAAARFEKDGRSIKGATVIAYVDKALGDMSAYAWLGYGQYQNKAAYIDAHGLASYAGKRVADALDRASAKIKDCYETDLLKAGDAEGVSGVRAEVKAVIDSLTECEKIMTAALEYPECKTEEKPSVLARIAEARENQRHAKTEGRGGLARGGEKSKDPEL
jgi:hypothetical protein